MKSTTSHEDQYAPDPTPQEEEAWREMEKRQSAPVAAQASEAPDMTRDAVAFRVLRKNHSGEWVSDGRGWCDGLPPIELQMDIADRADCWRIEYAYPYAPKATQASGQDGERLSFMLEAHATVELRDERVDAYRPDAATKEQP